jgi:hypothetical protein
MINTCLGLFNLNNIKSRLTEGGTDGVVISAGFDAELPIFQSMTKNDM